MDRVTGLPSCALCPGHVQPCELGRAPAYRFVWVCGWLGFLQAFWDSSYEFIVEWSGVQLKWVMYWGMIGCERLCHKNCWWGPK